MKGLKTLFLLKMYLLQNFDIERFVYEECVKLPQSLMGYVKESEQFKLHNNFLFDIHDRMFTDPICNIRNTASQYRLKKYLINKKVVGTNFEFDYRHFLSFYNDHKFLTLLMKQLGSLETSTPNGMAYGFYFDTLIEDRLEYGEQLKFFINDDYFLVPLKYHDYSQMKSVPDCYFIKIEKKAWHRTVLMHFANHMTTFNNRDNKPLYLNTMNFITTNDSLTHVNNIFLVDFKTILAEFDKFFSCTIRLIFVRYVDSLIDYIHLNRDQKMFFLNVEQVHVKPIHYSLYNKIITSSSKHVQNIQENHIDINNNYQFDYNDKTKDKFLNCFVFEFGQQLLVNIFGSDTDFFGDMDTFVSLFSKKPTERIEVVWVNTDNIFSYVSSPMHFPKLFLKDVVCAAFTKNLLAVYKNDAKKARLHSKLYFIPIRVRFNNIVVDSCNLYKLQKNQPDNLKQLASEQILLKIYNDAKDAQDFLNKINSLQVAGSLLGILQIIDKSFNLVLHFYPEIMEAYKAKNFTIADQTYLESKGLAFSDEELFNKHFKFFYFFEIK